MIMQPLTDVTDDATTHDFYWWYMNSRLLLMMQQLTTITDDATTHDY
jgi:hypothetical protein